MAQHYSQKSDQELISIYREKSDMAAFEELFKRYSYLAFFVCFKYLKNEHDCQDAVMEVFEKALIDLQKYRVKNFKSWLYASIRNYCSYRLRKEKRTNIFVKIFEKSEKKFMENIRFDTLVEWSDEQIKELKIELQNLPDDQQRCIRLFYFENLTYQEIAQQTGLDYKKVKSCIQNGRRNLKKRLSKKEVFKDVQ